MESKNIETCKAAHQAFNKRDFDAILNVTAEDVVYRDRARNVTYSGRAGYKEYLQSWIASFSNAEITEPTYIDGGDVVVTEFVGRGTNDGPLGPLAVTGKPAMFHFCEVLRFNAEGRLTSCDAYYDQLTILVQLGHAPALTQATAA